MKRLSSAFAEELLSSASADESCEAKDESSLAKQDQKKVPRTCLEGFHL